MKYDKGRNLTVNTKRYRAQITIFLLLNMEDLDFADMWFQQDRVTWHTACKTMAWLTDVNISALSEYFRFTKRIFQIFNSFFKFDENKNAANKLQSSESYAD